MKAFMYSLPWIIVVAILGFLAYWGFFHLDNAKTLVYDREGWKSETVKLPVDNTPISNPDAISTTPAVPSSMPDSPVTTTNTPITPVTTTTATQTTTQSTAGATKNQDLIAALQKLADSKILMKKKAQGPSVGTIQKFLNVYKGTNTRIDNDYGDSSITLVKEFQKSVGLPGDGQVGTTTLLKMIDWLKSPSH